MQFSGFLEEIIAKNLLNLTLKGHIFEYFRSTFRYFRGCPDFWSFQYGRYEIVMRTEVRGNPILCGLPIID